VTYFIQLHSIASSITCSLKDMAEINTNIRSAVASVMYVIK